MKEIFTRQVEIENCENDKLDLSILKKKSSSKTFKGLLLGDMKKAINSNNRDVAALIQHYYKKYMEFHKIESKQLVEIEIVEGWKGIDSIDIFMGFTEDFIIKRHQKDKETGEVTESSHSIPHENVNRLLYFIKKWEKGESHKCYDFAFSSFGDSPTEII